MKQLLDYIRGLRKGKEAHRLEKESMQDPFLADAMDGYSKVEGDHEQQIKNLQMKISKHSQKRKRSHAVTWSVAASLIIGISISSYFLFLKKGMDEDVFVAKEDVPSTVLAPTSPKDEVALLPKAKTTQDSISEAKVNTANNKDIFAKARTKSTAMPQAAPTATMPILEEKSEPIARQEEEEVAAVMDTFNPDSTRDKMRLAKASTNNMIKGIVTNEAGEPIVGASVLYKGTNIGTITDLKGQFSLIKKEDNKELMAQYIGYNSVEIPIDTSSTILIAMNEDKKSLNEMVVVGYGKQIKKKNAANASSTIPPESIKVAEIKPEKSLPSTPVIGMKQYKEYLKQNLVHPIDDACAKAKGKVVLTFLVNKEGRPYYITVKKSLCESSDREAIRLIQEGPDWTYGKQLVEITVKFK